MARQRMVEGCMTAVGALMKIDLSLLVLDLVRYNYSTGPSGGSGTSLLPQETILLWTSFVSERKGFRLDEV